MQFTGGLHFTLLASCHLELIVILNEEKALYGSSYKDPVNGWRKYFDEKTLADYVIIKEFVGDLDASLCEQRLVPASLDRLFNE